MAEDASVVEDFIRSDGSFGLKFGEAILAEDVMKSRTWFEQQTAHGDPYTANVKPIKCGGCFKQFKPGTVSATIFFVFCFVDFHSIEQTKICHTPICHHSQLKCLLLNRHILELS